MTKKNNSISQLIDFRLEKLYKLKELGIEPPHLLALLVLIDPLI